MEGVLRRLLDEAADRRRDIPFSVRLPDRRLWTMGSGSPAFEIAFGTSRALRRTVALGFLGFGEAYVDGEIEVAGSWDRLFELAFSAGLSTPRLTPLRALRHHLARLRTRDTRRAARHNIAHHYDLGNDFYRLWLDGTMTYSCAYFADPELSLDQAQKAKLELVCRKLRLRRGMTLLDVGCGWGSLVIHAARRHGVHAVGCTLSREQAELARERVAEAGVSDRVEIRLEDYRDIQGTFDRWVSVGMFEHVGKTFIPSFVERIGANLRPGGTGLLHTIGKEHRTPGDPWTLTYIFPGGYIPVLDEIVGHMGTAGLVPVGLENLRRHYALTLDRWRDRFEAAADQVEAMFDPRFVRMWRLFLVSSAAGFRHGDTRVFQVLFTNGPSDELPLTPADVYARSLVGNRPPLPGPRPIGPTLPFSG